MSTRTQEGAIARRARGLARRLADVAYVGQAGAAGLRLRDPHAVRSFETLRELESRYHLDVGTVLYIGANQGQDLPLLLLASPRATVHCFEPQAECQPALQAVADAHPDRVRIHRTALSDREGTAVLRRPARHDQASSLLEPNEQMAERFPHVTDWHDEEVPTTTLDAWAAAHPLADDVLVKMDVQGAEGLVMDGGPATFAQARLVICELAVVPTYAEAPDMRVMFDRLLDLGLGYAGETAQVRDESAVVAEFDGAFVRPRAARP
jgi:FkbM family methyltransferase